MQTRWFLDRSRWWLTAVLGLVQMIVFGAHGEHAMSALGALVLIISLLHLTREAR